MGVPCSLSLIIAGDDEYSPPRLISKPKALSAPSLSWEASLSQARLLKQFSNVAEADEVCGGLHKKKTETKREGSSFFSPACILANRERGRREEAL